MENYKVIILKSEIESFKWDDGLFAVQKQVDDILHLWKIRDGKLERYNDGSPNITCTGINNAGIIKTNMFISEELTIDDEDELSLTIPDIRNKIGPFKNLIAMIENGLLNGTVDVHAYIQKEIEQCKKSINYLSNKK